MCIRLRPDEYEYYDSWGDGLSNYIVLYSWLQMFLQINKDT